MKTPPLKCIKIKNPRAHPTGFFYNNGSPVYAYTGDIEPGEITLSDPTTIFLGVDTKTGKAVNGYIGRTAQKAIEHQRAQNLGAKHCNDISVNVGIDDQGDSLKILVNSEMVKAVAILYGLNLPWPPQPKIKAESKTGIWETLVLEACKKFGNRTFTLEELVNETRVHGPKKDGQPDRRKEFCRRAVRSLRNKGKLTVKNDIVVFSANDDLSDLVDE